MRIRPLQRLGAPLIDLLQCKHLSVVSIVNGIDITDEPDLAFRGRAWDRNGTMSHGILAQGGQDCLEFRLGERTT